MGSRGWSTNIKYNICPEILDEFVVVRRRDGGHIVTGELCKLDCILANRRRPSIDEEPRASGDILVTRLRKLQGPRSIQSLDGSVKAKIMGVSHLGSWLKSDVRDADGSSFLDRPGVLGDDEREISKRFCVFGKCSSLPGNTSANG